MLISNKEFKQKNLISYSDNPIDALYRALETGAKTKEILSLIIEVIADLSTNSIIANEVLEKLTEVSIQAKKR